MTLLLFAEMICTMDIVQIDTMMLSEQEIDLNLIFVVMEKERENNMTIEFGLFAKPLSEQLSSLDIDKEKVKYWENVVDFLMSAHLYKKLTDREQEKLYSYLVNQIRKEITKQ